MFIPQLTLFYLYNKLKVLPVPMFYKTYLLC